MPDWITVHDVLTIGGAFIGAWGGIAGKFASMEERAKLARESADLANRRMDTHL